MPVLLMGWECTRQLMVRHFGESGCMVESMGARPDFLCRHAQHTGVVMAPFISLLTIALAKPMHAAQTTPELPHTA